MDRLFIGIAAAFLAASLSAATGVPDAPTLAVGVAAVDITPDYPVRLSGFGGRRAESEGVTLGIWAKALAFADAEVGPAILIAADNLCVPDEITTEIARRLGEKVGLRRERLAITATHTHTAPMLKNVCPTLFGLPIPPEHQANIDRYTGEFIDNLERAALAAFEDIRPARLSWGIGAVEFAANRRAKDGPVDHDLPVLAVHDLDGKIRAIYFSYACHCVTLSDNKISGDWAGFAQKRIQELFPGALALASVGCGADSNPSSGVTGANVEVCAKQGDEIAREIKRLLGDGMKPIRALPEARCTRVDLPLKQARSRAEWEARAQQQDAIGHHARVNLERLDRGQLLPETINYPIQTWTFGEDLALVFLPGETVVDYSLRLKREFDRARLWVNGYSNDGRCYIPSERVLKEGGYEGGGAMIYYDFPQPFAPGVEQKIIDAVTEQIPASFKAPAGTEGTRPLSAAEALRGFRTKPGLVVELVAAEPLVQDPVAIDWGADGRLWVCEMHDYPSGVDQNWQPGGRIRFLSDDDGDGQYDRATLFLDKLPFPTGVTAWGRGIFICAAPDIIYAEDTDGDGKADKVEKLFTGFHTDNYQARVNSLNLGLDNWIYGANGLLGGTIQPLRNSLFDSGKEAINIRNRDFRLHPSSGTFELAGGLTQQGRARDDWGNWFGCDNSRLLLHFPFSEAYLRRNPRAPAPDPVRHLTSRPDGNRLYPASPLLARFNDPGHANRVTSAGGLGIYRDTMLGEEFHGNAFICEPVHNLVHREVPSRDLGFTSRRAADESESEFFTSTDNWFRPVQARPGPDGALYIVDMYRFLIEHPRWIPAARLAQIEVRAGADRGRVYRIRHAGKQPRPIRNLTTLNGTELAAALDTPNGMDRDRVHIELLWRKDQTAVPRLKELAAGATLPRVRLQALAAWDGLATVLPGHIRGALHDLHPGVREHALKLSEPWLRIGRNPAVDMLDAVLALTNDSSRFVLRQLAFTLGESKDRRAGRALANLAKDWLANPEMRAAILSSATPHCGEILTAVAGAPDDAPGRADWIPPLIATAANSPGHELAARAVRFAMPGEGTVPEEWHFAALATILTAFENRNMNFESFLDRETSERLRSALVAAGALAANSNAPARAREAAIALLGRGNSADELGLLQRLATEPAEKPRRAAISALKRQRAVAVADALLANWRHASPAARADLISLFLDREGWAVALLQAVKGGVVQPHEITLADRRRLATGKSAQVRKLAEEVLPNQPATGRNDVVEQYQPVLSLTGNASKGAEVFSRNCAACHSLHGTGQNVGPDLAPLRGRDAGYWLKNILDPNAVIEPRFVSYQIDLHDERALTGLIQTENANSLTIVSGSGVTETVPRSQVRDIRASSLSLMPEGLEQAISPAEMADLIAFAGQPPPAPAAPASEHEVLRDPVSVARLILDASQPGPLREGAIYANPQFAGALIAEMTRDLPPGAAEEYVRIPWIWRVAVACGKRNDAGQLQAMLEHSLPEPGEPLRDWQAVVIGGGIINGLGLRGLWPAARLDEILGNSPALKARWDRALDLAAAMADQEQVPMGTRYDALRMIALQPWDQRGAQLLRYLAGDAHSELQMGAVSGLADMPFEPAAAALIAAVPRLRGQNRDLALDALLRDEARIILLLDALESTQVKPEILGETRAEILLHHPRNDIQRRFRKLLGKE
jgi:putative membrane-bound dehydrogenase-like protein